MARSLTGTVNVPIYTRLNNKEIELGTIEVDVSFDELPATNEEISARIERAFERSTAAADPED